MYPFEKYRYYTTGNKIIAVSSYAGKTVRGVAKCAEGDAFDMEKGKKLAALRCAEKIAWKRLNRAVDKVAEAEAAVEAAENHLDKMVYYHGDAYTELCNVQQSIDELLKDM